MENKIVIVDDEPMMVKTADRLNVHHCVVCGEKVSSQPRRFHDSFDMCPRCSNWYEPLAGVLRKSLRRQIIGNVP